MNDVKKNDKKNDIENDDGTRIYTGQPSKKETSKAKKLHNLNVKNFSTEKTDETTLNKSREDFALIYFGKSDTGLKRMVNQDSFFAGEISRGVFLGLVCDGMGGVNGGNVASAIATDVFVSFVTEKIKKLFSEKPINPARYDYEVPQIIVSAVNFANKSVFDLGASDPKLYGMGTTLVAALIINDVAYICNIGDSRLYRIGEKSITQITRDHSFVRYLIDSGRMTEEEAASSNSKNIITRAIGTDESVDTDIFKIILAGDGKEHLLLCSDGLTNFISDNDILEIVLGTDSQSEQDIKQKVELMIDKANENGGGDNITVILVKHKVL